MTVKPISPSDVAGQKSKIFPDQVLEAFNEIIASHYVNGRSSFTLDDVVKLMVAKGLKRKEIFANNWLDVEPIYEENGWKVEFDKPAYNENYPANFTFIAKRKS